MHNVSPMFLGALNFIPPAPPNTTGITMLVDLPLDDPNGTTSPRDLVGIASVVSQNGASVTNTVLRNGRNTALFTSSAATVRRFEWAYRPEYTIPVGGSMTIEAWIYPTSLTSNPGFVIQMASGAPYTIGYNASDRWFFQWRDTAGTNRTLTSTAAAIVNGWQHVAAVYTPTRQAIYINGFLNATTNSGSVGLVAGNTSAVWRLGGSTFDQQFIGRVSDFRIMTGAKYTARRHIVT